ncbi:hypothetical protein HKCCE3408_12975 [Rhodobacterales bacterium HKCCE3408]|nr:hypothetical protein [Rhodobacterales bacterium HKCCE3408]
MAFQGGSFGERRRMARALRRVSELSVGGRGLTGRSLVAAEGDIEWLRQRLDAAARGAEAARVALARSAPIRGPEQCDWSMRPDLWTAPVRPRGRTAVTSPCTLSPAVTLFHDCPSPELTVMQVPRRDADAGAAYALSLEVYRFGGGFISLVQDLPDSAIAGLTLAHVFTVDLAISVEEPLEIYARLNLQHGPNTEQMVREMPVEDGHALAEFDLAYSTVNEKRVEKVWLDLIFEAPQMNRIEIRDMTVARAPRADI